MECIKYNRYSFDKPYSEDKWSFYGVLKNRANGKTMPVSYETCNGEMAIITEGLEDGTKFFDVTIHQNDGWDNIARYYEDGTIQERYEK